MLFPQRRAQQRKALYSLMAFVKSAAAALEAGLHFKVKLMVDGGSLMLRVWETKSSRLSTESDLNVESCGSWWSWGT